jgi:hypothetical protein
MDEQFFVFAAAGIILVYFLVNVIVRKFDPFAPVWLFLVGYAQVYIIQAVSYHEWALRVRGQELVAAANFRALWALLWFLTVYHLGISPRLVPVLPRPPRGWSTALIAGVAPPLILWGLYCAGVVISAGFQGPDSISPEEALLAHRHGPVPGFTPAALLPRRSLGRGRLRCNMDVQWQALTFADRCAVHGLCLLYHAVEAAVMACLACHVLRGCSRGGNRHWLAEQQ